MSISHWPFAVQDCLTEQKCVTRQCCRVMTEALSNVQGECFQVG